MADRGVVYVYATPTQRVQSTDLSRVLTVRSIGSPTNYATPTGLLADNYTYFPQPSGLRGDATAVKFGPW